MWRQQHQAQDRGEGEDEEGCAQEEVSSLFLKARKGLPTFYFTLLFGSQNAMPVWLKN